MNTITEERTFRRNPRHLTMGGYLEKKKGNICLRMGDTVQAFQVGKKLHFRVQRTWLKGGFNPEFYPLKNKPTLLLPVPRK